MSFRSLGNFICLSDILFIFQLCLALVFRRGVCRREKSFRTVHDDDHHEQFSTCVSAELATGSKVAMWNIFLVQPN